jgi:hypothetical protein
LFGSGDEVPDSGIDPTRHSLVFVGGVHRSGTTLVARILGDHPLSSGLSGTGMPADEGEHLQSVYTDSLELGGVGRFARSPRAHITESSDLVSEDSRRILEWEWSRFWDLDKRLLIEKSPPNLLKTRFLQALWPTARFVIVRRHPIAVTAATLKWRRGRWLRELAPYPLAEHWTRAYERFWSDAPYLTHLHVLHFEDLVAEPDRELRRLFAFLGVDAIGPPEELQQDSNHRYQRMWDELSRNPLRGRYLEMVERRLEARARRLGYSFSDPAPLPSSPARLDRGRHAQTSSDPSD